MVDEWNGKFIVVYLPSVNKFTKYGLCMHNRYTSSKNATEQILNRLNIPYIDANEVLTEESLPSIYGYYDYQLRGHLNPEGYRRVAEEVTKYLSEHGLD